MPLTSPCCARRALCPISPRTWARRPIESGAWPTSPTRAPPRPARALPRAPPGGAHRGRPRDPVRAREPGLLRAQLRSGARHRLGVDPLARPARLPARAPRQARPLAAVRRATPTAIPTRPRSRCARRAKNRGSSSFAFAQRDARGPRVFDVDVHVFPARGAEPAHLHHDVRYLLDRRARPGAARVERVERAALVPARRSTTRSSRTRALRAWCARRAPGSSQSGTPASRSPSQNRSSSAGCM